MLSVFRTRNDCFSSCIYFFAPAAQISFHKLFYLQLPLQEAFCACVEIAIAPRISNKIACANHSEVFCACVEDAIAARKYNFQVVSACQQPFVRAFYACVESAIAACKFEN